MGLSISDKEKYGVGVIFIGTAIALFTVKRYGECTILIALLLVLFKARELKELFVDKDGVRAIFGPPAEKIEEDLRQDEQPITKENIENYKQIEEKILASMARRYGGALKRQIHFVYGDPARPEFRYTPDGSLQTEDALYFFEIKHVSNWQVLKTIVDGTIAQLKMVHDRFAPSAGKRLIMKLILATSLPDLQIGNVQVPEGVEVEVYKV